MVHPMSLEDVIMAFQLITSYVLDDNKIPPLPCRCGNREELECQQLKLRNPPHLQMMKVLQVRELVELAALHTLHSLQAEESYMD